MKKLYHLLVTSYELRVKLPRFCFAKSPLQNLKGINYHHIITSSHHLIISSILLFCLLPFSVFAQTAEATVTNVVFSCPGIVTVTYDLDVCGSVNVTLFYSPDKCQWFTATTEEDMHSGTDKTIVWNDSLGKASFGKFYYKIEYSSNAPSCVQLDGVMINGVCWAKYNLKVDGEIATEHTYTNSNSNALYQWGRHADGHEYRSPLPTCLSGPISGSDLDSNGQPDGSYKSIFLIGSDDWCSPANDALWNSGTVNCPVKTDNDPCPEHWRVPTNAELTKLTETAFVDIGIFITDYLPGINGYFLKNIPDDGSSLFLPAAGAHNYSSTSFYNVNSNGYYWSSTPRNANVYYLEFDNSDFRMTYYYRAYGRSIRCVSEN